MKQMVIGASAFAALLLAAAAASVRNSDMMRVRGTIQGVDGQTLDAKGRDGTPIKVKLADDVKVLAGGPQIDGRRQAGRVRRHHRNTAARRPAKSRSLTVAIRLPV